MTPKEKAEQLVEAFYLGIHRLECKWQAQDCALIAVDEILDLLSRSLNPPIKYWQEVKEEIEKL